MKKTKYLTENQFRHLIRARVLTELKKIEQNSHRFVDYAYSLDKKCLEFDDDPHQILEFIHKNIDFGDVMSISHALFFGQGTIFAWKMEAEDFLKNSNNNINPRLFAPYRNGFVKILNGDLLLRFIEFLGQKYGNLSLYSHGGPDDMKYFKY